MKLTYEEQRVYDKIDDIINLINFKEFFTPIDLMFITQYTTRTNIYQLVRKGKIETCKNSNIIKFFQPKQGKLKYIFSKKNVLDFINTYRLFNNFKYEIFDCLYVYDEHIYQDTNQIYLHDLIEKEGDIYITEYISKYSVINDVEEALNMLSERERKVLILRFGLIDGKQRLLEEVGEIFGCSKERIRQVEAKALRRLRSMIRDNQYFNTNIFYNLNEDMKNKRINGNRLLRNLKDYLLEL